MTYRARKNQRGNLAKFAAKHPKTDIQVIQYIGFCRVYAVDDTGHTINPLTTGLAQYGRDRDAWRRLRELGYTREGNMWRQTPKADQPQKAVNEHACEN